MGFKVLVYGGSGALGNAIVTHFRNSENSSSPNNIVSIDFGANQRADHNIILESGLNLLQQGELVKSQIPEASVKFDAIICVAGGWTGGNCSDGLGLLKNSQMMMEQSVWTSLISVSLTSEYLKEGGLLILTGAAPALKGTPDMIAYGMAKAAVHQLTKSLGGEKSGMPKGSKVLTLLPIILDTPMNRKFMKHNDTWTPLEHIAKKIEDWMNKENENAPKSGSLLKVVTEGGQTQFEEVQMQIQ